MIIDPIEQAPVKELEFVAEPLVIKNDRDLEFES